MKYGIARNGKDPKTKRVKVVYLEARVFADERLLTGLVNLFETGGSITIKNGKDSFTVTYPKVKANE